MSIKLNYSDGIINIPSSVISDLAQISPQEIKTVLAIASCTILPEDDFNAAVEQLHQKTGIENSQLIQAIAKLAENGIVNCSDEFISYLHNNKADQIKKPLRSRELPIYTGNEIEMLLEGNNGQLKELITECQSIFGCVFNLTEINRVIALSDYLKLSNEYIVLLCSYCAEKGKTSVAYVEKVAYNLFDNGIDSVDKLDFYLKSKEEYEKIEIQLKQMFGIGQRSFTKNESATIKKWIYEYKFSIDMITSAYEKTVEHTNNNRFSFSYMNKILESWHANGYTSPDQVMLMDVRGKSSNESSFDVNEFAAAAIEKSRRAE